MTAPPASNDLACAMPEDVHPSPRLGDEALSAEQVVSSIGMGRFQYRLWLLCALGVAGDAIEKAALMYIVPMSSRVWGVHGETLGLLGASSALGQVLGSFLFGRASDIYGRRPALLGAMGLSFFGGLACAAAPEFWSFLAVRVIVNVGLGGALPVAFTILSEMLPTENRSRWVAYLYAAYGIGRVLTAIIALVVMHLSWRAYMVFIAIPGGLFLLFSRHIPETPQFLLAAGKAGQARAQLQEVAAENGQDLFDSANSKLRHESVADVGPWSLLCAGQSTRLLFFMWYALGTGTEWINWIAKVLLYTGMPSDAAYGGLVFINTHELVAPLLVSLLPKRLVLAWSQYLVGTAGLAAALLVAAFAVLVSRPGTPGPLLLVLCVLAAVSTSSCWVLLYTITPSFFSDRVRGTGFGLALTFNRLAFIFSPLFLSSLMETRPPLAIAVCSLCFVLLAAAGAYLGAPPREGEAQPSEFTALLAGGSKSA